MAGHFVMRARKATFTKNLALIEQKFGEIHREAFGEESKINKFG